MMDWLEIEAIVRGYATERGIVLWESFPWGGAIVLWPEDGHLEQFLELSRSLGSRILYLDAIEEVFGFAESGVIHAFPGARVRGRLALLLSISGPVGELDDDASDEYDSDGEDLYRDCESGKPVSGELRELVDRVVADDRFDGYQSRWLVAEYTARLTTQDAETVERVAREVFNETKGKELDRRAQQLAPVLAGDHEFDPLAWGDDLSEFLTARLPDEDPRVIQRLRRELSDYAHEHGLTAEVRREVMALARQILDGLPLAIRDQFGFASRSQARLQLLDAELANVPAVRREHVLREIGNLESEQYRISRESRYATAVRKLLNGNNSRVEISRRLRISTTVMDRLLREHRVDVELDADDPIRTMLAPEHEL
jgi:hypothetical protein